MFKNFFKIVFVVAAIAAIGFAANVQADYIYDFDTRVGETLPPGALNGHDGWTQTTNITGTTLAVTDNVAGWSGKILQAQAGSSSYRVNNGDWSYAIDNTGDFDVSAVFNVDRNSYFLNLIALQNSTTAGGLWGYSGMVFGVNNGYLAWYNNGTSTGQFIKPSLSGIGLATSTEYQFLIGFHYTAADGKIDCYYQNLTASGDKTSVGTMTLATDPSAWNQLTIRQNWGNTAVTFHPEAKLDNITISQVPEPSTLALLGCGLVGLLAYAWRKR